MQCDYWIKGSRKPKIHSSKCTFNRRTVIHFDHVSYLKLYRLWSSLSSCRLCPSLLWLRDNYKGPFFCKPGPISAPHGSSSQSIQPFSKKNKNKIASNISTLILNNCQTKLPLYYTKHKNKPAKKGIGLITCVGRLPETTIMVWNKDQNKWDAIEQFKER